MNTKKSNTTRDYYFDNLKGFLIICVIVGNSLEYIQPDAVDPHYLILFFYMFHMPLFAFISGYFCKKSRRKTTEKVKDMAKTYLLVQAGYFLFEKFILERTYVNFQLFYPLWTLWYLLSMVWWYIMSDYIKNYKAAIIITALLSLYIGFDTGVGSFASVSRTLFFAPFFIAGMYFNKEKFIDFISDIKTRIFLGVLSAIILVLLYLIKDFTLVEFLFEYNDYTYFIDTAWYPFIIRIFHYIGSVIICTFILSVMPQKALYCSWLGKNSLSLYIWHSGITELLASTKFLSYNSWLELILSEAFILSCTIIAVFAQKAVLKFYNSSKFKAHMHALRHFYFKKKESKKNANNAYNEAAVDKHNPA